MKRSMTRYTHLIFVKAVILISVLLVSNRAIAEDIESVWAKANDAYSMGEWNNALSLYQKIEKSGEVSAYLYYNIGNTYYKQNIFGKAVLYYERALRINPSFDDAINNLKIVQLHTLDKIENVPEFVFTTWIRNFKNSVDSNTWAVIGLFLLVGLAVLFLLYRFASSTSIRRIAFIVSCVVLFMVIVSFLFSFSLRGYANSTDSAVIMSAVSNVKSAPNSTGNNLFVLHEGTKVTILEDIGTWKRVELADGRQGWLDSSTIEII